jgi:hypothetical protein
MKYYSAHYFTNLANKFTAEEAEILKLKFANELEQCDVVINNNIPVDIITHEVILNSEIPEINKVPQINNNYQHTTLKEINNMIQERSSQFNYIIRKHTNKYRAITTLKLLDYHPAYLKEKLILDKRYNLSDISYSTKFLKLIAKQFNIDWYINGKKTNYTKKKLIKQLKEMNVVFENPEETILDDLDYPNEDYQSDIDIDIDLE